MSRIYRETLRQGQTSPPVLSDFAIEQIQQLHQELKRPLNILDVGCGSGNQLSRIIAHCGADMFDKKIGLDWSPSAVARLQDSELYDQVLLCESSELPFDTEAFDIAISIENVEHLYVDDVVPAIKQMARVATYIIIITPTFTDVINHDWLTRERAAAAVDPEPIDATEYQILEGAVHKSAIVISSMREAGFKLGAGDHGRYMGKSIDIKFPIIHVEGIRPISADSYETKYQLLLKASQELDQHLIKVRNT